LFARWRRSSVDSGRARQHAALQANSRFLRTHGMKRACVIRKATLAQSNKTTRPPHTMDARHNKLDDRSGQTIGCMTPEANGDRAFTKLERRVSEGLRAGEFPLAFQG